MRLKTLTTASGTSSNSELFNHILALFKLMQQSIYYTNKICSFPIRHPLPPKQDQTTVDHPIHALNLKKQIVFTEGATL
jgi:hypothetical protein